MLNFMSMLLLYWQSTRDITDEVTENFSGHLVAPDHELQPKSWFRAANRPLYVQEMLNSWLGATIWPEKYFGNLSVMSLLDIDLPLVEKKSSRL